ncbi:uncharacterized protein TNCV_4322831 [Trichonephila clavipes]|nr:uncharacterized protein TNCV_4322831 [Trichonephila clavipes]
MLPKTDQRQKGKTPAPCKSNIKGFCSIVAKGVVCWPLEASARRFVRFASCLFNNMTSETVEVARIALRLPPFWKSNVRLWIAQCDHAFTFSGISSDDTKYSALVANLDAETLSYVSDVVLSPPNSDKYHTLSQRIITQFSDSETQKIKNLLTDLQLDEKPSHLLRKMKELSNGQLQDDFLQSLWLQRMLPHIQTVLSASSESLDKLAIIADKVSEVVGASSTICAAKLFLHHPSHLHAVLSQPWTLSPGRSKSCLYKLLN